MKLNFCRASFAFVVIFLLSTNLSAHGGVSIQANKCTLSIGAYSMLFTGYQPKTSGQEFCDDIPIAGKTIIVLDFIDAILRNMEVDYRVVRDTKKLGIEATKEQLGSVSEIESSTVIYIPSKIYQKGTFMLESDFKKGNYIGIVNIRNIETGKVTTSIFPFSVGDSVFGIDWIFVVLILIAFAIYLFSLKRSKLE